MQALNRALLPAALAAAVLVASPASGSPGICPPCDRPDLVDRDHWVFFTELGTVELSYRGSHFIFPSQAHQSQVNVHLSDEYAHATRARGWRDYSGPLWAGIAVRWAAFEPDKVQRGPRKSSIAQSKWVNVRFFARFLLPLYPGYREYRYDYSSSVSIESCKAVVSIEETNRSARWKVQCGTLGDVLTHAGVMDPIGAIFFARLLRTPLTKKLKLGATEIFRSTPCRISLRV